ncbi:SBK2 kinase, partial [Amia calva]|nr:SBK2 kinase [Amia calva]
MSLELAEHFQVVRQLGQGSYGRVILAIHKKRGTAVALKLFPRHSTSLLSFLREYCLSLSLSAHPSLAGALGIVFSTPQLFIFAQTPALHGDLYDIIEPEVGVREEGVAQRVFLQLSSALSFLHSLGFVHRDVKPENVFLCDGPQCRAVRLGDFGLARARGSKVKMGGGGAEGGRGESPYCAPELTRGEEDDDDGSPRETERRTGRNREGEGDGRVWSEVQPSIDLWALGVLLYCLLTGCFPWNYCSSSDPLYRSYCQWYDGHRERGRRERERGVQGGSLSSAEKAACPQLWERGRGSGQREDGDPLPLQFQNFTPLALSLFLHLLNPDPKERGVLEGGVRGGGWERFVVEGPWLKVREAEREAGRVGPEREGKEVRERGGGQGEREET